MDTHVNVQAIGLLSEVEDLDSYAAHHTNKTSNKTHNAMVFRNGEISRFDCDSMLWRGDELDE